MPPSNRPAPDPFTDSPLRPTSSNATATTSSQVPRHQASQSSSRPPASAAPRSRSQRDLFAPTLSRRPPSHATSRVEDEVLADSESEHDLASVGPPRSRPRRPLRRGSPEAKHARSRPRPAEELEMVNRQPDGNYLLGATGLTKAAGVPASGPDEEAAEERLDDLYVTVARQYFTNGTMMMDGSNKLTADDKEQIQLSMMVRMRELVTQEIEDGKWLYEPTDRSSVGMS